MMLIDSHVNLHAEAFAADRDAVIERARSAGIGLMLTICDRIENFPAVLAIAEAYPDIWCSVGAHPHHAKDHLDLTAARLADLALSHPKVAAIGETGLDQHYGYSTLDDQVRVLRAHIGAARKLDLPIIIHTREADAVTAEVLEEEWARGRFRILMHCYTSGSELAQRALALGAYFSLSGILTFKKADDVRRVAAELPLDRLILETDCPYLAPQAHRGTRNEPAFLVELFRYFCLWRGVEDQSTAAIMADNFFSLFQTIPRKEF
jgi:TatD DNase family protein